MAEAFGNFKSIAGKGGSFTKATAVPLDIVNNISSVSPIPVTISGTNQITFTLNASKTKPVHIWNGNDFISLRESVAYTWISGSNPVLNSSGVQDTQTDSALGVWYFYLSLDADGNLDLLPSQTAPSFVEGPYESGVLGHPGTSRAQHYTYVGFQICTTASGAGTYRAMTKIGKSYHTTEANKITAATPGTSFAVTLGGGAKSLPDMGDLGVTVGGYLETGAAATAHIASDSNGVGEKQASISATGETINVPFDGIKVASGDVYSKHTTAAGDVHITVINDIV